MLCGKEQLLMQHTTKLSQAAAWAWDANGLGLGFNGPAWFSVLLLFKN
jgi:hypothetical protein